jgi:hypothetical protein
MPNRQYEVQQLTYPLNIEQSFSIHRALHQFLTHRPAPYLYNIHFSSTTSYPLAKRRRIRHCVEPEARQELLQLILGKILSRKS